MNCSQCTLRSSGRRKRYDYEINQSTSVTKSSCRNVRRRTRSGMVCTVCTYKHVNAKTGGSSCTRACQSTEEFTPLLAEKKKAEDAISDDKQKMVRQKSNPSSIITTSTPSANDGDTNSNCSSSSSVRQQSNKAISQSEPPQQIRVNNGWDDGNYDYIITSGEILHGRYKIMQKIGSKGAFGQVVQCLDIETNKYVAVKIIKSRREFYEQSRREIAILRYLRNMDFDARNIVRLITHFMHRNHQCLVFEMLSFDLYQVMTMYKGGISLGTIRNVARQILATLSFLARQDVDVIHCDLKPENVLLQHPKITSAVKIIDFGSSCLSNGQIHSYIQSRFYRAPEVMLGLTYTTAIDMWSLGCMLVELRTGMVLFQGVDQFDQMEKIVDILGMIPTHMLERSSDQHRLKFFKRNSSRGGQWELNKPPSTPPFCSVTMQNPDTRSILSKVIGTKQTDVNEVFDTRKTFVDLISKMLQYDPEERIKPEEAIRHPFFQIARYL